MKEDASPNMWTFWRDKHGICTALEDYYPNTAKNEGIRMALHNIQANLVYIDTYMNMLEDE
jgi:hypothetical protein